MHQTRFQTLMTYFAALWQLFLWAIGLHVLTIYGLIRGKWDLK